AVDAAERLLPALLEATAADVVAELVEELALVALRDGGVRLHELLGADLVHVAEEVAGPGAVAVAAMRRGDDVDAGELARNAVRLDDVELLARDVHLHRERAEALEASRRLEAVLGAGELVVREREQGLQAPEDVAAALAAEVRRERHVVGRARVDEELVVPVDDEAAV